MIPLLDKYKEKKPEIVFEWNDAETDAKGWVVINSLRNGAAGGGTRMRKGLVKEEVVSLSKVMEIKFSVCGPDIGGAKSGIDFDPSDPRKEGVLKRWYKAVFPLLKYYYGTGGDMNVDELKDVIPITEDLGLWHPQEGIVNGHLQLSKGGTINAIGQLRYGCAKIVEDSRYKPDGPIKLAVADMITGYGVAEAVNHYYKIFKKETLKDKRVIVQGWGNVASAAGVHLSSYGAKVVGIIDRDGGVLNAEGFTLDEIKELYFNKEGNKLASKNMMSFDEINEKIWSIGAEVFIPGAASKIITRAQVDAMIANNLEVISCGANVPFIDDDVFFGPTAKFTDEVVSVIPDFIANCGMARVFAYLMQPEANMTDEGIFEDVSDTIENALQGLYDESPDHLNLSTRALKLAINKLM